MQIHLVLRFMPVIRLAFAGRAKNPDQSRLLTVSRPFWHSMRILLQLSFLVKCVSRKQMAQSMFWL